MFTILVVEDDAPLQRMMSAFLGLNGFSVVGAANGEEALKMVTKHRPDVVLMDLRMPVLDGVSATRRIKDMWPESKVIVLTTFDDDEYVFDGLRAGAVGYLLKDVSSEKLVEAVRAAARGEYFLLPSITAKVMAEFARVSRPNPVRNNQLTEMLSARELEVLRLVAQGASNKSIADQLVIAEGTVKNHLTSILAKLEVKDRMQAVFKAKELGLI